MSAGPSRQRSNSTRAGSSSIRSEVKIKPPTPSATPGTDEFAFDPISSTASFLLVAQGNEILCLHHDTLAVERRFTRHREEISWIQADTVSERGGGRLVVSYDAGSTAIVWDLFTGDEVARFASYEQIRVASWMRNGNVAFGNAQGNIILFEPSTSEHLSARTIFDPITALAPAADCRTFAIGYLNGSILIATLQPSFTILHTLTTPRSPSPIAGLAWHGSSSKQKSEMLAAQTLDGDLRVWSVPKVPHSGDVPCVIRVLNQKEQREPGPSWFAWSKNGRIVQHTEGQTCAWDVRTKRVSYEQVPTIDNITAICNYGPTATLFTVGRNFTIQQYDMNPQNGTAQIVANVQHAPANTPPSPPNSLDEQQKRLRELDEPITAHPVKTAPQLLAESESDNEGAVMSPLEKIAAEMDQLEEERRDRLGPLSPVSSRGSQSSRSSGGSGRAPRYRYDKPSWTSTRSSKSSGAASGTVFSSGTSSLAGTSRESISIRSISSAASSRYGSSALRKEVLRSPDESKKTKEMDLFPFTKARLSDVPFRPTELGPERTPDDLRRNMLKVVFGWDNDIDELIRDELARHQPESAAAVLLSKWLGDIGADLMASMVGSESMTSTDWMLLALSNMGQGSQKKVSEAFVQRLLEKGDIHPAVAIFLGIGEHNDAIEVYVSRKYYMEAILLTCLIFPTDWQRQSFLVRKWGEHSVSNGKAELAVRCFSCMGLETTEPWFSPRAQDAVFSAQKQALLGSQLSPPLSPPSVGSSRVAARMASLKLVTDFNRGPQPMQIRQEEDDRTPMNPGVTPIAESALSPSGARHPWRTAREPSREPSSARTATPGAYRRKRLPSRSDTSRATTTNEVLASLAIPDRGQRGDQPRTAVDNVGREAQTLPFSTRRATTTSETKDVLLSAATYKASDHLPSPAVGIFETLSQKNRERSESRGGSRSRKPMDLHLDMKEIVIKAGPETNATNASSQRLSPPLTGTSLKSAKIRSIDQYISSLDEANNYTRPRTTDPVEDRPASRTARARSRPRDESQSRGRSGVRYIRPAKRSPSSPVPMSPEDAGINASSKVEAGTNTDNFDDERFYKMSVASPIAAESVASARTARSRARAGTSRTRGTSKAARREESPEGAVPGRSRVASRTSSRRPAEYRGRSTNRGDNSPASPQSMHREDAEATTDYEPVRARNRSTSRRPRESAASTRREPSTERRAARDRSVSRKPTPALRESSRTRANVRDVSPDSMMSGRSGVSRLRNTTLSRREQAAKELADRRLSLARRPSAPVIPDPGEFAFRPVSHGRSNTDDMLLPSSTYRDPIQRSQTADPEMVNKYVSGNRMTGATSTTSVPIGLPANPRAMRHPRYMTADPNEENDIPAVPSIPQHMQEPQDDLGPLLPSTTFGQPIVPPSRAASAPPQDFYPSQGSLRASPSYPLGRRPSASSNSNRGHSRQNTSPEILPPTNYKRASPPPITASIAETMNERNTLVIDVDDISAPPVLAQLQHLATPPPPPPPPLNLGGAPNNIGMINIAIDEMGADKFTDNMIVNVPTTTSPHSHRRGRGSVSDNLGMTFKRVTERMRSTSRSRAKSPPMMRAADIAPYESVPEFSYPRSQTSPPAEGGNNDNYFNNIPPPPPPPPQPMEQVVPPSESQHFYKHPMEVRANMPPATLQPGVYQPDNTPMI
ncbi:hypothetical protein EK21DRAFT_67722 [Setomelanomma holmii]|uniref:Gem-associated protein 5 TPR domain-containing protein n=1 Tax=Setomelanomma holmii TaxID=210430 RepID=A0A9P4H982_9PLEO|nr:hypothetical protein EK21DRAFT_67722 [Setomelanomma holmii]